MSDSAALYSTSAGRIGHPRVLRDNPERLETRHRGRLTRLRTKYSTTVCSIATFSMRRLIEPPTSGMSACLGLEISVIKTHDCGLFSKKNHTIQEGGNDCARDRKGHSG